MSGTTPSGIWREWDGDAGPDGELVYVRDGDKIGDHRLLAQTLRLDGVSPSLAAAGRLADDARFEPGFYGWIEGYSLPVFCDDMGYTLDGDRITSPIQCMFAAWDTIKR